MLYRLRTAFNSAIYDTRCRAVLGTSPLETTDAPLVIVSMLGRKALIPYLVAIKSLYRTLRRGRVLILNDGTLDESNLSLLRKHVSGLICRHIADIDVGKCPKGGTWERLLLISELAPKHYVIQLDSDTVTCGDTCDVMQCINDNVCFTLNSEDCGAIESQDAASQRAERKRGDQVQLIAERCLPSVRNLHGHRYVRGCSGFAGFASGSISRDQVEAISQALEARLGRRWWDWGSEQVTSNLVVANAPAARVLPFPKYASFLPGLPFDYDSSVFMHFFGTYRYRHGRYVRTSQNVIKSLLEHQSAA
jgi:hypothetical protein